MCQKPNRLTIKEDNARRARQGMSAETIRLRDTCAEVFPAVKTLARTNWDHANTTRQYPEQIFNELFIKLSCDMVSCLSRAQKEGRNPSNTVVFACLFQAWRDNFAAYKNGKNIRIKTTLPEQYR